MSDTVKVRLTSWHSVSFNVVRDTHYSREEWDEMPATVQDEILTEIVCQVVDVEVLDD